MKTTRFLSVMMGISSLFLAQAGFAKETKHKATTSTEPVSYSEAGTYGGSASTHRYGLGFAATTGITDGNPSLLASSTAITGIMELNSTDMIQVYAGLGHTSPIAQIGFAGLYKHTVAESQNAGFHIGGGIGVGNFDAGGQGAFFFSVTGVAGLHMTLPNVPHVLFQFDGGPVFNIIGGVNGGGSTTTFGIGGLSASMGLSVAYMF